MKTLKIKLKQHTPLIHFQHDQEGATLRASEVKPKLDRFILSRLTPEEMSQGKSEGWIKTKNDRVWLDYKMRIEAGNYQNILIPIKPVKKRGVLQKDQYGRQLFATNNYPDNNASLIMSNIGGRIKEEIFNFSLAKNIQMTIITNSKRLKGVIVNYIGVFFGKNCFGNRTSKGFGSFEVISIEGQETDNGIYSDGYILSFTMDLGRELNESKVYKDVFKIIHLLWKTLKNFAGVRGKTESTVLLNISPQNISNAERIPSPILFKPLIDFFKEGDSYYCDVNIATLFNIDVIKQVTGKDKTIYYKTMMSEIMDREGDHLYDFLDSCTECEIDKESVNLE